MISYETWCQIRDCRNRKHMSLTQIAKELHLNHRTVSTWAVLPHYQARKAVLRTSVLDPFKGQIARLLDIHLLDTHPFSAQKVFQQLLKDGYLGSYTTVKTYVSLLKSLHHPASFKKVLAPREATNISQNKRLICSVSSTYSFRIEQAKIPMFACDNNSSADKSSNLVPTNLSITEVDIRTVNLFSSLACLRY